MSSDVKKIVVWSWSRDPSIKPFEKLIGEGKVDVVLWVSMFGKKTFHTKKFSYVPAEMLHKLVQQQSSSKVFYKQSTDQLNSDLNRFFDIYSRVNFSKGCDYHDHVNLFHLYYQYFTNILITNEVDAVVYFGAPHVGADYILYLAAKAVGVEITLMIQSPVKNRFFCVNDVSDYGKFESCSEMGVPITLSIPREHEKTHFYSANMKNKRNLRIHKLIEDSMRAVFPSRQPISWTGVWQNLSNRINFLQSYKKVIQHSADLDRKFVYFPLHLQPEFSTSFLGDEYSDQLLAIEKISALIPDDWYIYVKENPSQGAPQRNALFYERLKRIPNCSYLSEQVNTYDLMKASQFVASITGTACWEAISGGKPAVVFGNIWFMALPGITVYRSDVTLDEIMNNTFEHEQLEAAYSEVMSRSIPGIVIMSYTVLYDEYDEEKNAELLTDFLRKRLCLSA